MDLIEDYSKECGITYKEALKHFQPISMESEVNNTDLFKNSLEQINSTTPKLTYTAKDMKELIDNDPKFKRNIEERNKTRGKEK